MEYVAPIKTLSGIDLAPAFQDRLSPTHEYMEAFRSLASVDALLHSMICYLRIDPVTIIGGL
jgi:hypothetical protein